MTTIPDGFREVTKDEFFAALAADKRDIMPSTEARTWTPRRVQGTREMWGWMSTGYASPYGTPRIYAIKK